MSTLDDQDSLAGMLAKIPVTESRGSLLSAIGNLLRVIDISESSIMIPTLLKDRYQFDAYEMLTLAKILKASILGHNDLVEFYMSESSSQHLNITLAQQQHRQLKQSMQLELQLKLHQNSMINKSNEHNNNNNNNNGNSKSNSHKSSNHSNKSSNHSNYNHSYSHYYDSTQYHSHHSAYRPLSGFDTTPNQTYTQQQLMLQSTSPSLRSSAASASSEQSNSSTRTSPTASSSAIRSNSSSNPSSSSAVSSSASPPLMLTNGLSGAQNDSLMGAESPMQVQSGDPDATVRLLLQIEQLKTFIPQVTNLFESVIELYKNSVEKINCPSETSGN